MPKTLKNPNFRTVRTTVRTRCHATLTALARENGLDVANFVGLGLEIIADKVVRYQKEFAAVMEAPAGVPDDLPEAIRRLEELIQLGHKINAFHYCESFRLQEVIDRWSQLSRLANAARSGER